MKPKKQALGVVCVVMATLFTVCTFAGLCHIMATTTKEDRMPALQAETTIATKESTVKETVTEPETTEAETTTEVETTAQKTTTEIMATVRTSNGGTFKITVYCPSSDGGKWGYATASGETAVHLKTCAVDPNVIPLGTTVYINGLELRANDTGSAVKGNVIDVFYDGSSSDAIAWVEEFGTRQEVTW